MASQYSRIIEHEINLRNLTNVRMMRRICAKSWRGVWEGGEGEPIRKTICLIPIRRNLSRMVETLVLKWETTKGRTPKPEIRTYLDYTTLMIQN